MSRKQFEKLRTYILLVEDDPDHADLAVRALEKNRVADKVVVARDGEEALSHLFGGQSSEIPAMVLLDLKLPRMSGFEVLRRIRENEMTRFLPVVVLSSSDEDADLLRSYELGVNSYILKPVSFTDFVEVTRQVGTYWLKLNQTPVEKQLGSRGVDSPDGSGSWSRIRDFPEKETAAQDSRKGVDGVRSGRSEEREAS